MEIKLFPEDKIAIILSARISGFGPLYEANVTCYMCGEEGDRNFDLTKKSISPPPPEIQYNENTNTFFFELPSSKIEVELENITPEIEESLEKEKKQKQKYNLEFNRTIAFLQRCIVSANSITEKPLINQMIQALPAIDARAIKEFYSSCRPTLSLKQETEWELGIIYQAQKSMDYIIEEDN